ncbi:MAG: tRNA lysidine(34) synthetase TilS, partial [Gammaproteobacteria bacterium]
FTSLAHDSVQILEWSINQVMDIPSLQQTLVMNAHTGLGLDKMRIQPQLQVGFRQGGERICPAGRQGHHSLKKLFQEAEVPPWLRDRIPLIYQDGELIAVAGYWVADEYKVAADEAGLFPELIAMK